MNSDASLDAVGFYCPLPIVKTSKAIKEIEVGQVLEVIADDEGIKEDMPAWCQTTGHEFLGLEEEDGEIRLYVRRTK
jgi:TusA-related sulfurtransferase